eukprot:6186915-Pleurochrysis_carterae.AAC.1
MRHCLTKRSCSRKVLYIQVEKQRRRSKKTSSAPISSSRAGQVLQSGKGAKMEGSRHRKIHA